MMQRILSVSHGYLRFIFIVMGFAAIAFFLAGLAIKDTPIFLLVIVLGIITYFVAQNEVKSWRHSHRHQTASDTEEAFQSSLAEMMAFAETTALLSGTLTQTISPVDIKSLWVSEWTVIPKLRNVTDPFVVDRGFTGPQPLDLAMIISPLKLQSQALATKYGLHIIAVSQRSGDEILKSIRMPRPTHESSLVRHIKADSISIVFAQGPTHPFSPDQQKKVEDLLSESLQLTRLRVFDSKTILREPIHKLVTIRTHVSKRHNRERRGATHGEQEET